jgi:predicted dehydrogenase
VIRFQWEYPERLRAGFIGCGDHAFRNIYPCLQYAPVELAAVCDRREERARAFASLFGAASVHTDHRRMLEQERLQVVFIVTGYDAEARPTYPPLAIDSMRAGAHVWIEKPPAASVAEIEAMRAVERETGRFTMVGFKKMFFPAVAKAAEIAARPEFGGLASLALRYPQSLPPMERRGEVRAMLGFLDHLCHPASILQRIAGPVARFCYEREVINGGLAVSIRFRGGPVGALHLAAGISGTSPLERLEIVGHGANLVVENGCRLTYYRPGGRGEGGYGRAASFVGPDEAAPLLWEPEFSLGQLYNKGLFLLGYAPEILAFCDHALQNRPPEHAGLADALEITRLYEAFLTAPEGEVVTLPKVEDADR